MFKKIFGKREYVVVCGAARGGGRGHSRHIKAEERPSSGQCVCVSVLYYRVLLIQVREYLFYNNTFSFLFRISLAVFIIFSSICESMVYNNFTVCILKNDFKPNLLKLYSIKLNVSTTGYENTFGVFSICFCVGFILKHYCINKI